MKQLFYKAKTGTIRITAYSNNRALIPSAATVTLYASGSTSVLQAETAATVDATTGEMTYALTAVHTASYGINYKAVWKYTVDTVDYYATQLFDVVNSILSIPITDDDLFNELEALRKVYKQATGTATAGAAGSLTDTLKRKEPDNEWKGGILEVISGTGDGQSRDVTGNTQSTGVITVSPDFVTNPDTTSVYRIVKSFTKKIESGFEAIEQMLYDKGRRDALILESSQIKMPLIYLTIHMICLDVFSEIDDKWYLLATKYWDRFNTSMATLKLDYDEDESGAIEGLEAQSNVMSLRINRV